MPRIHDIYIKYIILCKCHEFTRHIIICKIYSISQPVNTLDKNRMPISVIRILIHIGAK